MKLSSRSYSPMDDGVLSRLQESPRSRSVRRDILLKLVGATTCFIRELHLRSGIVAHYANEEVSRQRM